MGERHDDGEGTPLILCVLPPWLRVKHLILVDPWGFPVRPADPSQTRAPPTWVKAVAAVLGRSNPLAVLRVAGPWGEMLGPGALGTGWELYLGVRLAPNPLALPVCPSRPQPRPALPA